MKPELSKLKQYSEILELLFNNVPYVLWKDRDGHYRGANTNQINRFKGDFLGKTIFEVLADQPEMARSIDAEDNRVMDENITVIKEEKAPALEGEKVYLAQKSPIHDEAGKVVGMLEFSVDVTTVKRQEALLKLKQVELASTLASTKPIVNNLHESVANLLAMIEAMEKIPAHKRAELKQVVMIMQGLADNLPH